MGKNLCLRELAFFLILRLYYSPIGFRERDSAFQFMSAIQDHIRSVQRARTATKEQELYDKAEQGDEEALKAIPHRDFSMKEGQTFGAISIGGVGGEKKPKPKPAATGGPSE